MPIFQVTSSELKPGRWQLRAGAGDRGMPPLLAYPKALGY